MKVLLAQVTAAVVVLSPVTGHADDGGKAWSIELELGTPDTTVFRGDGRSPDVIFEEGFRPRGTNGDLAEHQVGGGDSAFVSTSKAITEAEKFARYEKGALYVIRDAKGVDVNDTFGKDAAYPEELEIAVPDGIRRDQIVGAWLADADGNYTVYVPNPGHEPGFRSSDPVLARDAHGRFYDARSGRRLTDAEVKDAQEREKLYKSSPAVRLVETSGRASAAMFEAGRTGKYGSVDVSVGGVSADWRAHASVTKTGVQAGVNVSGRVTVLEIDARTKKVAGAQAAGRVFVGTEAEASATADISLQRIAATGKVGAFDGAKVTGTLTQSITVCGVSVKSTATVDASWGTGAEAKAYVKFDWTTGTVKAGGHASASLDPGVGYGQEVEVSIEKLLRNPKGALTCGVKEAPKVAWNVATKGAGKAVSLGKNGLKKLKKLKKLCFRCGKKKKGPPPFLGGYNGDRGGKTGYVPPGALTAIAETTPPSPQGTFFRP